MTRTPFIRKLAIASFIVLVSSPANLTGAVDGRILLASKESVYSRPFAEPAAKNSRSFDESAKVRAATEVLRDILKIPERSIPPALLRNAHGIAIIPGSLKAAFILSGRYGSGVLLVHDKEGGWSNPVFIRLYGGGIGWQIGVQSTDVILVFKSAKSVNGIPKGKFTLGADASVAAGPVGRSVEAATDAQLKAEIYSYSRNRGLFAGVSLEGAILQIDNNADEDFYGKEGILASSILADRGVYSPDVQKLKNILTEYASSQTRK